MHPGLGIDAHDEPPLTGWITEVFLLLPPPAGGTSLAEGGSPKGSLREGAFAAATEGVLSQNGKYYF
jgi:hypothetical protein